MAEDPAAVIRRYFACVKRRDPSLVDLFHDDASLIGLGARRSGRNAIRDFYAASIEGASPSPTLQGDLLVSGTRVAAEILITLADGSEIHAVDLFVVEGGRIRSLTYFLADHGPRV